MTSLSNPPTLATSPWPTASQWPAHAQRAPDAIPTELTATYYAQRATAGLIISEATAISPEGQGYADVPGLYGTEQLDGWKR